MRKNKLKLYSCTESILALISLLTDHEISVFLMKGFALKPSSLHPSPKQHLQVFQQDLWHSFILSRHKQKEDKLTHVPMVAKHSPFVGQVALQPYWQRYTFFGFFFLPLLFLKLFPMQGSQLFIQGFFRKGICKYQLMKFFHDAMAWL